VLTVDFDRFPIGPGDRVLDVGAGAGRHSFEAFRRGGDVVAVDAFAPELPEVLGMLRAMRAEGQAPADARFTVVRGDALGLPFPDGTFDRVIAAEMLEHIPADQTAITEIARVTRPGGLVAVTVPAWLPERVCWALSDVYHNVEGGHVRIYRADALRARLADAGLVVTGGHRAHALHAPYWWLKCLVGPDRDVAPVRAYHRLLVWDMIRRPALTRLTETALDPVLGKSLVVYLRKPTRPAGTDQRA
jgi:SAM-dependent methyltransferase